MILSSAAVERSCRYFADPSLPSEKSDHFKLTSKLGTKGVKLDGNARLSFERHLISGANFTTNTQGSRKLSGAFHVFKRGQELSWFRSTQRKVTILMEAKPPLHVLGPP